MKLSVRPPRFAERRPAPVILSSRGSSAPLLSAFLRPRLRPASGCLSGPAASAAPAIPPAMLRCGNRHRKHLPPSVLLRIPTPAMLSAVAPVRKPAPEILSAGRSCAASDSGNSAARSSCGENGRRTRSAQGRFIPAARFRSPFVSGPCGKLHSDPRSALPGRERISNLNR